MLLGTVLIKLFPAYDSSITNIDPKSLKASLSHVIILKDYIIYLLQFL